jgi:hypothetical protein
MFAFLPLAGRKANSRLEGSLAMIRALGPGSVSSFLKVILDVFYYVLWVAALLVGVAILGLLLISFDPHVLPPDVLVHADIMGHAPGLPAAMRLSLAELSLICVVIIVQRLRRIFGAMTAGDPFHPDNVRRLRVIAAVLALSVVIDYLGAALDRFALGGKLHIDLNLTAWFAVLVIVVLSEVFREGARLRRDAELTI